MNTNDTDQLVNGTVPSQQRGELWKQFTPRFDLTDTESGRLQEVQKHLYLNNGPSSKQLEAANAFTLLALSVLRHYRVFACMCIYILFLFYYLFDFIQ